MFRSDLLRRVSWIVVGRLDRSSASLAGKLVVRDGDVDSIEVLHDTVLCNDPTSEPGGSLVISRIDEVS